MTIKFNHPSTKQASEALADALRGDDAAAIANAFNGFGEAIADEIRADYENLQESNDRAVLAQRGYRTLTTAEERWYNKVIEAMKQPSAAAAKQAFIDILASDDADDIMPDTILEDVFRYLAEERPLLARVRFSYVGYSTKWIINDSTIQKGKWGKIDAKITAEIQGALKVIDLTQNKYSAFCVIPIDILDMGPTYLDAFIRATLAEAMGYGIEDAIINGTGVEMPIGLTRDPNSAKDPSNGYTKKTAVKAASFKPADYGALVAKLAKTEKGRNRTFQNVQLIVNMTDYLTKVMPASTVLTSTGEYRNNIFPFPTEVIPSSVVEDGSAILCLLDDYTFAVGGSKNGVIEYDDSVGFLDDTRTFKVKTHADGRAFDNTSAILLDISDLAPTYIVVENVDSAAAASYSVNAIPKQ